MPRRAITGFVLLGIVVFMAWRFIRPMNIFVVDDRFDTPVVTTQALPLSGKLGARDCSICHQAFYDEWRTTIHSQAWTDPYFQVDWQFDDAQHICRLCHTPLDRQQPYTILGYRDKDKWKPILAENPDFDAELQHEGVTCAACHYREGEIVGVLGTTRAPHPVKQLEDPNQVCIRCHIVEGDRWDTFFRFPPCGTVAEIESTLATTPARTGEVTASDVGALACVECHMPLLKRPLVEEGVVRDTRQHLWRGGHSPEMVRNALTIDFEEKNTQLKASRIFQLTVTNTGAAHYVPTGTPDRHLTLHLRVFDKQGGLLDEQRHTIKRTILWRPFIVDLWDNRLARWQPQHYELEVPVDSGAMQVEAEISYHLLDESRRRRIGYENRTPIHYTVFHKRIPVTATMELAPVASD